jgi:polyferredoxin
MKKNILIRWGIRLFLYLLFVTPLIANYGFNTKAVFYSLVLYAPIVFGVLVCGWICPAGLIQDIVFFKKFGFRINEKAHKYLRILRYVFAILFITGIYKINADIQHTIGGVATLKYDLSSYIFYVSLSIILISVFIERFFCKYLCPYGAMAGIKSLIRLFTINRDTIKCVGCKMCDRVCPMQITVSKLNSNYSPNCIDCFKCVETCPKKAVKYGIRNYKQNFAELINKFKK